MTNKLDKLLAKQEQLANQIKQEEAKERTRQRKLDTRRKILLGSLVQSMMEKDKAFDQDITARLDSFLDRAIDREAFDMNPKVTVAETEEDPKSEARQSAA